MDSRPDINVVIVEGVAIPTFSHVNYYVGEDGVLRAKSKIKHHPQGLEVTGCHYDLHAVFFNYKGE